MRGLAGIGAGVRTMYDAPGRWAPHDGEQHDVDRTHGRVLQVLGARGRHRDVEALLRHREREHPPYRGVVSVGSIRRS